MLGVELITFPNYKYNAQKMVTLKFEPLLEFDFNVGIEYNKSRWEDVKGENTHTVDIKDRISAPVYQIEHTYHTEILKHS